LLGDGVGDDDEVRLVDVDDDDVLAVRLGCLRELSAVEASELLELSMRFLRGRLEADRICSSLVFPPSESENRSDDELAWL